MQTANEATGYTADQVRSVEGPHLAAGEPLMARAAAGLAAEIDDILRGMRGVGEPGRLLVLAGSGDNGGDALFAAATLAARGHAVDVVRTGTRIHEAGLAAALAAGAAGDDLDADVERIVGLATVADVVVDGILGIGGGTGAEAALRGRSRDVVGAVRSVVSEPGGAAVVAVDLPSGIGADDGGVPDPTVLAADVTVTFGAIKAGLLLEPAASLAGRVVLVDIGLASDYAGVQPTVTG